jgi:hypothetical protein
MKQILVPALILLFTAAHSQNVGIGTSSPNAALDVSATNNGILIPRVALTGTGSASPLTSPATSTLVYNTATVSNVTPGYYYWSGTAWIRLIDNVSIGGATTVSNTSSANTLSTTVNGVTGTGVNIINSNTLGLTGNNLSSTINSTTPSTQSLSGLSIAGDVTGTLAGSTVGKIQGEPVSAAIPTAGQVLEYIGSIWTPASPTLGTVTSIGTTAPITGGTITGSGTIGISQATTSTNGYLSSTDWNTFNNKQGTVSLTTTGSSGAATFSSNTLNIPNYTLAGLGGQPTLTAGNGITISSNTISDNLWTASSTNIYNANSGNVGIGYNAPAAKLSVSNVSGSELTGTSASSTFKTYAGSLGTSAGNSLKLASIGFSSSNQSSLGIKAVRTIAGTGWSPGTAIGLEMDVDNTDAAGAQLWLNSNGNVGVGTSSPISTLHTAGTLTVGPNASAGTVGNAQITTGGASPISNRLTYGTDGTGWKLAFSKNQGGAITDQVTIQDNGYVGIGTTTPGNALDVENGNIDASGYIMAGGTGGGAVLFSGTTAVNGGGVAGGCSFESRPRIGDWGQWLTIGEPNGTNGGMIMQIQGTAIYTGTSTGITAGPSLRNCLDNGSGWVGLGTTSPAAALDITSSTSGFLPPRMASNPAAPAQGMVYYNTGTNCLMMYNGTSWQSVSCACTPTTYTGGSISYSGGNTFVTFTGSGTFTSSCNLPVMVLVVGGGGGGGGNGGGGGGGGGVVFQPYAVAANTPIAVTVGGGGAGTYDVAEQNGGNSSFGTLTAIGGGGGGSRDAGQAGNPGGSGGGRGGDGSGAGGGAGTAGQGNNGGATSGVNSCYSSGGGGGGASGVGGGASSNFGGGGGAGITYFGVIYGGGGGGGVTCNNGGGGGGTGGSGVGGNGVVAGAGGGGAANRGGGGGGGGSGTAGGAGGSGIVIVVFPAN